MTTVAQEKALGRKVDLGEYDALKPLIRERVLSEEVPIMALRDSAD